jgi:signal transduction histidine kinase
LDEVTKRLHQTNESILKHTLTVEELAVSRERNRILRELHDSIGQAYTSNLTSARFIQVLLSEGNKKDAVEAFDEMTKTTTEILDIMTNSVNIKKEDLFLQQSLQGMLDRLFYSYEKTGMVIEKEIQPEIETLPYKVRHCVYRICQEAITNAVKHGHAKMIRILIKNQATMMLLIIEDDGLGCDVIFKGVGLRGIEYRAEELGGQASFQPGMSGRGFLIQVELPLGKEVDHETC